MKKTYRIEIEALKLIDVEANSKKEALQKIKDVGLHRETTSQENYGDDINCNYHYEECDFNKANIGE